MNSNYCAYFRTHRESMGMTTEWVAQQLGVSTALVQRFEHDVTPSNDALDFIEKWRDYFLDQVANYVTHVTGQETSTGKTIDEVLLYRQPVTAQGSDVQGLTPSMHTALQTHILFTLELQGRTVHVQWAPQPAATLRASA